MEVSGGEALGSPGPFTHHPYGLTAQQGSHYWPIVPVSHWLAACRRTQLK